MAFDAKRARNPSSESILSNPLTSASISSWGTSKPFSPLLMMSLGPVSQSTLIGGQPCAIASNKTMGKPSKADVKINTSAARYQSATLPANPGRETCCVKPSRDTCASRSLHKSPFPSITRCQSGWLSLMRAKASSRRSKRFCSCKRPAASSNFLPSGTTSSGSILGSLYGSGRLIQFGIATTLRACVFSRSHFALCGTSATTPSSRA